MLKQDGEGAEGGIFMIIEGGRGGGRGVHAAERGKLEDRI